MRYTLYFQCYNQIFKNGIGLKNIKDSTNATEEFKNASYQIILVP